MRWTAVALALALLGAGAAAGWALRPAAVAHDEISALEDELAAARADRRTATAALADAQSVTREQARTRRASTRAAPPSKPPATSAGDAEPAPPPPSWSDRVAASYPLFPFDEAEAEVRDALAGVDWVVVGASLSERVDVAADIAASLARGEPPAAEVIGRFQELNGPLVTIAMRLQANGVPGTGANGAFTHPAFMVNAIAASLEACGLPLDAGQAAQLAAVGAEHALLDRRSRAGYTDGTLALRRLVDESDRKRTFFASAFAVLDERQRAALTPAEGRDRVALDLFSEGLVWVGRAVSLVHRDDAHLAELALTRILEDADDTERGRAAAVVGTWAASLPAELRARTPDALDRLGMVDARHATECGRHTLRLVEALLRDADIGSESAERLRNLGWATVPFRTATD